MQNMLSERRLRRLIEVDRGLVQRRASRYVCAKQVLGDTVWQSCSVSFVCTVFDQSTCKQTTRR